MPKSLLYLSPNSSANDKVAKLDAKTFVRRLEDLSKAVQSLNQLERLMKKQNKVSWTFSMFWTHSQKMM